jgi:hypothetical protein
MVPLKKASRPLTRKRQLEAALELLKPPADKREQYRHTIEQALDRLMARSEVDINQSINIPTFFLDMANRIDSKRA